MQNEIERLKNLLVEKDKIINQNNQGQNKSKDLQDIQKSVDDQHSQHSKAISTDQERPKKSSVKKVDSFRMNLLGHVIDHGFPKGFSNNN